MSLMYKIKKVTLISPQRQMNGLELKEIILLSLRMSSATLPLSWRGSVRRRLRASGRPRPPQSQSNHQQQVS